MADRLLSGLDPVPAGDVGRAEVPALYDGQPRRLEVSDVVSASGGADTLDLSRLASAIRDNIPDGAFLLELGGVRLRLPGAALADFIDNAIAADSRQGADGETWTPSIVVDGQRRLQLWTSSGGDWGYATSQSRTEPPFDPSSLTKVKADAASVVLPVSGGGGGAVVWLTEAEVIAGVEAAKAVSALTLKEWADHFKLFSKLGAADVFDFARVAVDALTAAQREAVQARLGVLTLDGHWSRVGGETTWANAPIGLPFDTTLDVPADADDVRVSLDAGATPGGGVFVVSVATLRGLPALAANPPSFTLAQAGWHVVQDSRGNDWGIALRGARLWVASDLDPSPRNDPFSAYLDTRTGQLEDFAAADRDDRVPPEKMAAGWLPFTAALKSKLDRIEAEAEVNVRADLSETDPTSDAFVEGQGPFKASLPRGTDVSALPTALAGATTEVVVKEADDRRDAVVSFAQVAGQEYYGHGRGAVVAPTDASGDVETATWNAEVFGLLWDSGDRNLDGWLKVGSVWDKVVVNGVEHAMTELGQGQLPWDTSAPAPVYRRVQVALSAAEATAVDDGLNAVRLNLRDTDQADLSRAYVVGNPYIRESVRADDRLNAAGVDGRIDAKFRYVDSAADRPAGHEADGVIYFFPAG